MASKVKSLKGLEKELTVSFESKEIEPTIESKLVELSKTLDLKGFRKGKVPMNVVKGKYYEQCFNESLSEHIEQNYIKVVIDEKLNPVSQPKISMVETKDKSIYTFKALIEVMPEIELKNIDKIKLEKPVLKVKKEDLEKSVDKIAEQYKEWNEVKRKSKVGDRVKADFEGTINGEAFENNKADDFLIEIGSKQLIPGFEEGGFTDLFNNISATNPQPTTGGFAGPQFQIDDGELGTARQAIQIELRNSLLAQIDANKPAGMIAFPGAVAITYNQLPAIEYGQDLVTIKEQAILQIPLFKAVDFGPFIAKEAVATYEGGPVRVEDPSQLIFGYTTATTSSSVIANAESLTFTMTGKPRLIWEYDASKLTSDLAGLPKTAINNAITAYPGIDKARVRITPFWKRTFPENPEDIEVVEIVEEAA